MKVTRAMRDSLIDMLDGDGGNISIGRRPLTMRQMQTILDIQGYFAGVRYRFYPEFSDKGKFTGWRIQERQFGTSAN